MTHNIKLDPSIFSPDNPYWHKPPEIGGHPLWYLTQRDFINACHWEQNSLLGFGRDARLCLAIQIFRANTWWKLEWKRLLCNWLVRNKRRIVKEYRARQAELLEAAALRGGVSAPVEA